MRGDHMKITEAYKVAPAPTVQQVRTTKETPVQPQEHYSPSTKQSLSGYSMYEVKSKATDTFTQPNWDVIPTQGGSAFSDEQLIAQAKQLASNAPNRETATEDEWNAFLEKKERLAVQYISGVSPDRKALHAAALKVAKKVEQEEPDKLRPLTLLDFLIMDDLNLTFDRETRELLKKSKITPIARGDGGFDYNVKYDDEVVLKSVDGQWTYELTDVEHQRQQQFEQIFQEA